MDRRPNRSPALTVALVVVGLALAVAIAVFFDAPTSVYLLAALAIGFGLFSIYSSRRGNR
jgi:hypothetical protein